MNTGVLISGKPLSLGRKQLPFLFFLAGVAALPLDQVVILEGVFPFSLKPNMVMFFLSAATSICIDRSRNWIRPRSLPWSLLLLGSGLVSLWFADDRLHGMRLLAALAYGVVVFELTRIIVRDRSRLHTTLMVYLASASIVVLWALVQYLRGEAVSGVIVASLNCSAARVSSSFSSGTYLGVYLASVLGISVGLLVLGRPIRLLRVGLVLLVITSLIATYLTFSRSAWIAGLVIVGLMVTIAPNKVRTFVVALLILSFAGGIVFVVDRPLAACSAARLAASADLNALENKERLQLLIAALEIIRERPLTGVGPGEFPETYNAGSTQTPNPTPLENSTSPTVEVRPSEVQPGGLIDVEWRGIPAPIASNWIGLFKPDGSTSFSGHYLDGSASGRTTLVIPGGLTEGNYDVRLLANPAAPTALAHDLLIVTTAAGTLSVPLRPSVVHNSYLEVAAEVGIPGLLGYVGLIADSALRAVIEARRTRRGSDRAICIALVGGIGGFALGALALSVQYFAYSWFLFALAPIAALVATKSRTEVS